MTQYEQFLQQQRLLEHHCCENKRTIHSAEMFYGTLVFCVSSKYRKRYYIRISDRAGEDRVWRVKRFEYSFGGTPTLGEVTETD